MMTSLYSYLLCYYEGGNSATLASPERSSSSSSSTVGGAVMSAARHGKSSNGSIATAMVVAADVPHLALTPAMPPTQQEPKGQKPYCLPKFDESKPIERKTIGVKVATILEGHDNVFIKFLTRLCTEDTVELSLANPNCYQCLVTSWSVAHDVEVQLVVNNQNMYFLVVRVLDDNMWRSWRVVGFGNHTEEPASLNDSLTKLVMFQSFSHHMVMTKKGKIPPILCTIAFNCFQLMLMELCPGLVGFTMNKGNVSREDDHMFKNEKKWWTLKGSWWEKKWR
jgi:hypothetical protein